MSTLLLIEMPLKQHAAKVVFNLEKWHKEGVRLIKSAHTYCLYLTRWVEIPKKTLIYIFSVQWKNVQLCVICSVLGWHTMWHTLLYILGFVETFFGICVHCVKCLKAFQSNWKSVSRIPMHFDFSIDWDLREKVSKNSPAAQFIIHLSRQKRVKTMKGVRKKSANLKIFW